MSQALRTKLGARTNTLVLLEDEEEQGGLLPSLDLALASRPCARWRLRCRGEAQKRWCKRFAAFVARNLRALQQLEQLDLLGRDSYDSPHTPAAGLRSIAQLAGLRSLGVMVDTALHPSSWSSLRGLAQLTSLLRAGTCGQAGGHLQAIAAAAPQLLQLAYLAYLSSAGAQGASAIASLASLASLQLVSLGNGDLPLLRALTALAGLTHLGVRFFWDSGAEAAQALGQLSGLVSLEAVGLRGPLEPLEALQQLTSLRLGDALSCPLRDAEALARLGALRSLDAAFESPAAAAAAGLGRLDGVVTAMVLWLGGSAWGTVQLAAGSRALVRGGKALQCLDTRQVRVLELEAGACAEAGHMGAAEVARALRSCVQLHALRLERSEALRP